MSVDLTTYRIEPDGHGELHPQAILGFNGPNNPVVLVPDTRLQDIADAWANGGPFTSKQYVRDCWPELADLLDALTQEDNDE